MTKVGGGSQPLCAPPRLGFPYRSHTDPIQIPQGEAAVRARHRCRRGWWLIQDNPILGCAPLGSPWVVFTREDFPSPLIPALMPGGLEPSFPSKGHWHHFSSC